MALTDRLTSVLNQKVAAGYINSVVESNLSTLINQMVSGGEASVTRTQLLELYSDLYTEGL